VNLYITHPALEDSELEDTDKEALELAEQWLNQSSSYAQEQATRPSTIGHVLSSSPLALLAWYCRHPVELFTLGLICRYRIGEKFLEWSDEEPSLDSILTNVSLYWFTSSHPTSICKRTHVPM
jgi:microsomal epoxide hydrolase